MNINVSITDEPGPAFSVTSIDGSFEKQFFVFINIHLFTELQVFQGSVTSFGRLIWNRKTLKTVRKCNNLGTLVIRGGLWPKLLFCNSIFWERSPNFVVKKVKTSILPVIELRTHLPPREIVFVHQTPFLLK